MVVVAPHNEGMAEKLTVAAVEDAADGVVVEEDERGYCRRGEREEKLAMIPCIIRETERPARRRTYYDSRLQIIPVVLTLQINVV